MGRRIALNFDDVRGARVTGELPVTEAQINEVLTAVLQQRAGRIKQVRVEVRENNYLAIGIHVAIGPFSKWLWPELKIERRAIWDGSPVVILEASSARYGALTSVAEMFTKEVLPPGVRIGGRQIVIELAAIQAMAAYRQYLWLVKDLQIATETGRLWINFELRVD